jgi:rhamnose transport system ATP-binding protein
LRDASLEVRAGEIHALVGENGAGKSTLVRIVTGALTPDSGEVTFDGKAVNVYSPTVARSMGIAAYISIRRFSGSQRRGEPCPRTGNGLAHGRASTGGRGAIAARELLARVGARIDVDREAAR